MHYRNPRRLAKIFKVLPHLFFSEYEVSIWVDASVIVKGDLTKLLLDHVYHNLFTCFRHFKRHCLYDEAKECIVREIDDPQIISKQVANYASKGFPKSIGLIWGAVLIRNHNNLKIINVMEEWWNEIDGYSVRDQISFNYIAWKLKLPINYLPFSMLDSPYFAYVGHSKKGNNYTHDIYSIFRIKEKLLMLLFGRDWVRKTYRIKQMFKCCIFNKT